MGLVRILIRSTSHRMKRRPEPDSGRLGYLRLGLRKRRVILTLCRIWNRRQWPGTSCLTR